MLRRNLLVVALVAAPALAACLPASQAEPVKSKPASAATTQQQTPPPSPTATPTPEPVRVPKHTRSFKDGGSYGMGMPVSLTFSKPVPNQKEVRQAIKVTSDAGQEVRGYWFSAYRLDFRPESYWIAGSSITVEGLGDKPMTFKIARQQIATVDAATKTMTVKRDGQTIRTIPITAGSAKNPTYNGDLVISEKAEKVHMDGKTVGLFKEEVDENGVKRPVLDAEGKPVPAYDIEDVPHAMRLSKSGTFIHGNYWQPKSVFGKANTSAGCIGLPDVKPGAAGEDTIAKWFYENSMVGDVVRVVNSPDGVIKPDNGLNSWNLEWSQWMK
ncbi:L,D-transpeptidase [Streptomyces vinaceus]|uniref:L,D-transpeptidase n=1 Tax=Streptomyces vinaceus TaxID=1960 RepID=UPI0036A01DB7